MWIRKIKPVFGEQKDNLTSTLKLNLSNYTSDIDDADSKCSAIYFCKFLFNKTKHYIDNIKEIQNNCNHPQNDSLLSYIVSFKKHT